MKFIIAFFCFCLLSFGESNSSIEEFFNQKDPSHNSFSSKVKKAFDNYSNGKYSEALEIWQELCDKKDSRSCTNLGFLYDGGLGVKQDYEKAVFYYNKACENNDILGCKNLGLLYFRGNGVTQNFTKAAKFFQKGCDLNDGFSCANLGYQYENGDGVIKNELKAVELYTKACVNNDAFGCLNLGTMQANGSGGLKSDFKKAEQLFKKSCDLNNQEACKYLKSITSPEFNKNHANMEN